MTNEQPEALRLADAMDDCGLIVDDELRDKVADELRRLHELCYDYLGELTAMRAAKQMQDQKVSFKCTVVDDQHPNGVPLEQWGNAAHVQEQVACQHKRYSVDVREQTGTCYDCGAEGRMRFVVDDTTPPAAQPAPDLQAELEATNRQVEILSDALAESRCEIAQLKAETAQGQEPVAIVVAAEYEDGSPAGHRLDWRGRNEADDFPEGTAFYTTPPKREWVDLTRNEAMEIINSLDGQDWQYVVDAIESKLKEKNT
jgi:hypothetical protein